MTSINISSKNFMAFKNLKTLFLLTITMLLVLSGCREEQSVDDPAKAQIAQYTKELKDCKKTDKKEHASSLPILPGDIVIGDRKSRVTVVEYFSPTCPHCGYYHQKIFPEIKAKYIDTNKIAYVIREFIANKQDLEAAILARCSNDTDTYFKFLNIILNQQNSWAASKNYRENLTNIGGLGGVSAESFSKCLNDQDKIKILMDNTKLATSLPQFAGTPSFFINGNQFNGKYNFEELSKAIKQALGD